MEDVYYKVYFTDNDTECGYDKSTKQEFYSVGGYSPDMTITSIIADNSLQYGIINYTKISTDPPDTDYYESYSAGGYNYVRKMLLKEYINKL